MIQMVFLCTYSVSSAASRALINSLTFPFGHLIFWWYTIGEILLKMCDKEMLML